MNSTAQRPSWIQTDALYLECIHLTPGVTEDEIGSLVEFHLEAHSPVLLEQLFWGYFVCDHDKIWILAVPRSKVDRDLFENVTNQPVYHQAVLSILLYTKLEEPSCLVVQNGTSCIAFRKATLESLPEALILPMEKVTRFLVRQKWVQSEEQIVSWTLDQLVVDGAKSRATFSLPDGEGKAKEEREIVPEEQITAVGLDLRPGDVIEESQTEANKEQKFKRIALAGVSLAAVGLLALFVLWLMQMNLNEKWKRLEGLEKEARQVDEAQELVLSLRQAGTEGLRPLQILALINGPRPDSLYFTSVEVRSQNQLQISGYSGSVAELNQYTEALSAMPGFRNVRSSISSRAGRVSFDVSMDFDPEDLFQTNPEPSENSRRAQNE